MSYPQRDCEMFFAALCLGCGSDARPSGLKLLFTNVELKRDRARILLPEGAPTFPTLLLVLPAA
jgi:hypothetical protein